MGKKSRRSARQVPAGNIKNSSPPPSPFPKSPAKGREEQNFSSPSHLSLLTHCQHSLLRPKQNLPCLVWESYAPPSDSNENSRAVVNYFFVCKLCSGITLAAFMQQKAQTVAFEPWHGPWIIPLPPLQMPEEHRSFNTMCTCLP